MGEPSTGSGSTFPQAGEPVDDALESPLLGVGGNVFFAGFGAVFLTVGVLIVWGLTKDLDARWRSKLGRDGYGTPAQIRAAEEAQVEYAREHAAWQQRQAAKAPAAEAPAAEDEDYEPNDPGPPPKPMPEGRWARFTALSTDSRKTLFVGPIAGVVFFGIGLFIVLGALANLVQELPSYATARRRPKQYWLHDRQWARLRGRLHGGAGRLWGGLLMAFVFDWVAFNAALFWWLEPEPEAEFTVLTVVAVLVGAIVAAIFVSVLVSELKYGSPALLLSQVPFEPGKPVRGRLVLPPNAVATTHLDARLSLVETTVSGTGKNRHTHEHRLWTQQRSVPRAAFVQQNGRWFADVAFELPADATRTKQAGNPSYHWEVALEAETPGVDFEQTWEVPVYRVANDADRLARTDWTG